MIRQKDMDISMANKKRKLSLTLSALGVVYGDIGTSPLYALRESLRGMPLTTINILGVLSLILWSLILVISIKYLLIVFRADNEGEGGSLALLALLKQKKSSHEYLFYLLAIFGAGLLIGDGMLTPAISVSSAIEGLHVISPAFDAYIVPLSCVIMLFLFMIQSKGTTKIGHAFGPILLVWFITIAVLGLSQILKTPFVLKAFNPFYAYHFLWTHSTRGYFLVGGIFLVVTGGEAMYADIGHFGKNPIRYSWFFIVLPCLLLNYFGQGAHLMTHPETITNPFYMLPPGWFAVPMICLATVATIIASQAVISATFSLTKQAILLGLCPRLPVIQTSKHHYGQIYIPQMNVLLLIGALVLILHFQNAAAMAHAYGIAVNLDMLLVTIMVSYAARQVWQWPLVWVIPIFGCFYAIDLAFLGANAHKFLSGGWVPVAFACIVAFFMYTWRMGMEYLKQNYYKKKTEISKVAKQLNYKSLNRLPDVTAIFITDIYDNSGGSFLHFLKLALAVPEHILIVNYAMHNVPYVAEEEQIEIQQIDKIIYKLTLHYGFMDTVSIPKGLELVNQDHVLPFEIKVDAATYLVEIPHIVASKAKKALLFYWQEKLFAFLMRNYSANINIEFYQLPLNRTIAIGTYCII